MGFKIDLNNKLFIALFSAIPIILLSLYFFENAVNVPYLDDMELVSTINDIQDHPEHLFNILTRQQNEHRSFIPRSAAVLVYLLKGVLDFKSIIMLSFGNLLLLGFSILLILRSTKLSLFYVIPISFFLFTPFVYTVHLTSLPAFQSTLSIAFSFLALYFLQEKNKKSCYWAIPLAVLSSLTFLDGISIFPVLLLWLAIQKRWRHLLFFGIFTLLYFYFYFFDFKLSSSSNVLPFNELVAAVSVNFLTFIGSIAKIVSDSYAFQLSFISGIIFLGIFVGSIVLNKGVNGAKKVSLKSILSDIGYLEISFIRLLASAFMISVGRSSEGVSNILAIRYDMFSISFFILILIFIARIIDQKWQRLFQIVAVAASILTCVHMYIKYNELVGQIESGMKLDSYNYKHSGKFFHQYMNLPDPEPEFYRNYKFPTYYSDRMIKSWEDVINNNSVSQIKLRAEEFADSPQYKTFQYPMIELTITDLPDGLSEKEIYLGMLNTSEKRVFHLISLRDLTNNGLKGRIWSKGKRILFASIPNKLNTGDYKLGLVWVENGVPKALSINQTLNSKDLIKR